MEALTTFLDATTQEEVKTPTVPAVVVSEEPVDESSSDDEESNLIKCKIQTMMERKRQKKAKRLKATADVVSKVK